MNAPVRRPCVFFDRDGIANRSPGPGYVNHLDDFHILPGFADCVRAAAAKGVAAVIVTNQRGIERGLTPPAQLAAMLKRETGLDAVGVRLQNGEQFPYAVQQGFACDFAIEENDLHVRDAEGRPLRDAAGRARLRCTCGLVLSGDADPDRSAENRVHDRVHGHHHRAQHPG